ncbi:MAG: 50S ribosomal protein L21 [Treponema sp.]|nr:50S ribosomal protein L21 [Spirochaetia bacterium]MDD7274552.1 50S ribosomal protein L21 [Treponema sp.]MDY3755482.1 50S ribosomal protein L21 [Treponema sp.]MDY4674637.1 50S ribosomal protein L21 [Treponema sp.]
MYALVEYKGKQYKAEKDALIQVDNIDAEKGTVIEIDTVLLVSNEGSVSVGAPYVKGAKVKAVVEESIRDKKLIVYKYKSKKDYHRTIGHRQQYTTIRVQEIVGA